MTDLTIRKLDQDELEAGLKDVQEKGFVVFDSILTEKQCEHYKNLCKGVQETYEDHYYQSEKANKFHGSSSKSKVKLVYNLHNKHENFLSLIFDENVAYLNDRLLRDGSYKNSEPYQVHLTAARGLLGPCDAQQLHVDSNLPGASYVMVSQVFWALDPLTAENGATRVVPGSQKRRAFAGDGASYDDEVLLTCSKGSLIVVDGGVWHGSSKKQIDQERWLIVNSYSRWFMKPTFDLTRNTPQHIFDRLTDEQKTLMGFKYRTPLDEFTRTTRISERFEYDPYVLPDVNSFGNELK